MGWEKRKRGGLYYTRSRKIRGRVIREYVGTGLAAEFSARMDELERGRRDGARIARRAERDSLERHSRITRELCELVDRLVSDTLRAAGYHFHRGEWRRRRGSGQKKH